MVQDVVSEVLKVISNPIRRRVIRILSAQGFSYIEILSFCGLSVDTDCGWLNYHLRILAEYGILIKSDMGYELTPFGESVSKLLSAIERESHKLFKLEVRGVFEKSIGGKNLSVGPAAIEDAYDLAMMKRSYFLEMGGRLVDEKAILPWVKDIKKEIEGGFCIYTQPPWYLVPWARRYVVAKLSGELVGYVSIVVYPTLGNPIYNFVGEEEYVAHIDEVFVKEEHRRQGIRETMLGGALNYIKELRVVKEGDEENENLEDLLSEDEVKRIANRLTIANEEYLPSVQEADPHAHWFHKAKKLIKEKKGTSTTIESLLSQVLNRMSQSKIPEGKRQAIIRYLMRRPARYNLAKEGKPLKYVILTAKDELIRLYKKLGFHTGQVSKEIHWMVRPILRSKVVR